MAKARKTLSIRVNADDYSFLNQLAAQEREDISKAVRNLVGRGRVMLASGKVFELARRFR